MNDVSTVEASKVSKRGFFPFAGGAKSPQSLKGGDTDEQNGATNHAEDDFESKPQRDAVQVFGNSTLSDLNLHDSSQRSGSMEEIRAMLLNLDKDLGTVKKDSDQDTEVIPLSSIYLPTWSDH